MTILEAYSILKSTKPARCERDRYRQRDELQHLLIPHLPVDDRDKFERAMIKKPSPNRGGPLLW